MWKHFIPKWPIVALPTTNIEPMVNTFWIKDLWHPHVIVEANIPFGRTQHNFHMVVFPAFLVEHKIDRVVEINGFVIVAIQKTTNIKSSAHAKQVRHFIGVFEGEIECVITSKTTTRHPNFVNITFVTNRRNEFVGQKTIVNTVIVYTHRRLKVFGVPTVSVDAVNRIEFYFAWFNQPSSWFNQSKIFVLVITPHRRRKEQNGIPPMPKHLHLNVTAQGGRIPLVISFFQGW